MAGHVIIAGMTESGKTYLAHSLVKSFRGMGIRTIVLPKPGEKWPADCVTEDKVRFLAVVKSSQKCAVFVDECGSAIGRYNDEMEWLATQSRHNGHRVFFLMQGGTQVSPIIRDNCGQMFLFRVSPKSAAFWAEEFANDELFNACKLPQYHYYRVGRFEAAVLGTLKN
jgi:hypothetical protein